MKTMTILPFTPYWRRASFFPAVFLLLFHGTAFGFLRNRKIQAVNPFSTETDPAYTRVQSGFTLSGPLKKD